MKPIRKLLVANRGEIAVRVIRAARARGIRAVAVYSDVDRASLHVRMADEAYAIGPAPSTESYLRIEKLLDVARRSGADAVHPGYGFLAENDAFADACEAAGLVFVGPPGASMRAVGDKVSARKLAQSIGVPTVPGSAPLASEEEALAEARRIGYPVMIKASRGGGGKGMRLVHGEEDLGQALRLSRGESSAAFGSDEIYLERGLDRPRHVEVQVLADREGNAVYLGERECSIQRRHQKLVEETPCTALDAAGRRALGEAAVRIIRASEYVNAGTVEFMLDRDGSFYFLEVNARLQVEHPITEMVTGIDIVQEQLRIAAGEPLGYGQDAVAPRGHAIECRIAAEDPEHQFLPSTGKILRARLPEGPGVRNDAGIYVGWTVPPHYDSLLSKLVTWGRDREEARRRMRAALEEYLLFGVKTNIPLHRWILDHPEFVKGETHTGFLADHFPGRLDDPPASVRLVAAVAAAIAALENERRTAAAPARDGASPWKMAGRPGARQRGRK